MGDPADADEFEGQQAQQGADRGDDGGARVAGGGDQGRQVEGDQLRDGQQQPGQLRLRPGGQLGEVADLGPARMVAVGGAALGRGGTRSRGKPASVSTSATPVRFSGVGVPRSSSEISLAEWPARRSSMMRGRAAFFAGALVGPGRGVAKNPVRPARKSRTAERSVAGE